MVPGAEEVPSGEETTVEMEFATDSENQTEWGMEVFPTNISLLSGKLCDRPHSISLFPGQHRIGHHKRGI